ncbi:MerR family transcriptional regulator [Kribbella deserti]|uniref:MerR family transcriptional regulator n=1 Tax=Kribbella deserti TaxID=1926257 RepID=A0ABV6QXL0_9ACTN
MTVAEGMRAGELAAAAGVNRQTLRYYERRGLLAEPDRTLGGHRLYPPEALTTLRVIKAAKRLGFTLDEITALLRHGGSLQGEATTKLAELESRIADLTATANTLRQALAAGCTNLETCAHTPNCPAMPPPPQPEASTPADTRNPRRLR